MMSARTAVAPFTGRLPWRRPTPTFPVAAEEPTYAGLPIRAPMTPDEQAAAMERYRLATSMGALVGNLSAALHLSSPDETKARAPAILAEIEAVVAKLRDGVQPEARQREAAMFGAWRKRAA